MRPTDILPVHGNQNRRPSCRPLLALFLISCLAGLAFSVLYGRISLLDLTIEFSSQPAAARREGASAGPESAEGEEDGSVGTRWAVLIAGSNGYQNYRHQADICHAYQILKKGGLKDANIIVFMYDDIAHDPMNPRPGVIINHPRGRDVYAGVPKDYTGKEVNVKNFFAVLLGDKTGVSGGSGKVVNSGPNDRIFIFYSDHGSPGLLTMPTVPSAFYGTDLVEILKKKHAAKAYKSLVFYLEACDSGSIFKGILPTNIDLYATTSSNSDEGSFGIYCLREYDTCLGDLYSVSWMENSEVHNLRTESLRQQYLLVKKRTEAEIENRRGSHVMQYGSLRLSDDPLYLYMGTNPDNEDSIFGQDNSLSLFSTAVSQRDADLVYLWQKYLRMPENTPEKSAVWTDLLDEMAERYHVDNAVALIGVLLFGPVDSPKILSMIRTAEEPLVDDWSCLKSMVHAYEEQCGRLSHYGLRHSRSFANMCNAGIRPKTMASAAAQACKSIPSNIWESIHKGSRA